MRLFEQKALELLPKGVFLATGDDKRSNVMTISWGSVAHIWNKHLFMVMVRPSRFSYELIESHSEFTLSFPKEGELKKALGVCGSKSGRDVEKFALANITPKPSRLVKPPIVGECELFYECKVVQKQPLLPTFLDTSLESRWYPKGDLHVLYYGEILSCYDSTCIE